MVPEVGGGSGLATCELVLSSSQVMAVEPGLDLTALLEQEVPGASLVRSRLEGPPSFLSRRSPLGWSIGAMTSLARMRSS